MIVDIGMFIREKLVNDSIGQLSVDIGKIIILVEDHSSTILMCWKDKDVGIGPGEWRLGTQ